MGESRSVIRQTQDTRCYVNIPTTQRSSTLPLRCAALLRLLAWITGPHLVQHAGRDFVGLARRACVECVDLDQTTHGCAYFSPPPGYPTSQITAVAQCSLAVLTLACPKKAPWIHRQTFCSTMERKKKLQPLLAPQWLASARSIEKCRLREVVYSNVKLKANICTLNMSTAPNSLSFCLTVYNESLETNLH